MIRSLQSVGKQKGQENNKMRFCLKSQSILLYNASNPIFIQTVCLILFDSRFRNQNHSVSKAEWTSRQVAQGFRLWASAGTSINFCQSFRAPACALWASGRSSIAPWGRRSPVLWNIWPLEAALTKIFKQNLSCQKFFGFFLGGLWLWSLISCKVARSGRPGSSTVDSCVFHEHPRSGQVATVWWYVGLILKSTISWWYIRS